MRLLLTILSVLVCLAPASLDAQRSASAYQDLYTPDVSPEKMVSAINYIRTTGCRCGRKKMPPVAPIKWNDKLYQSASNFANEMKRTRRFDHVSRNGDNVASRLDKVGYYWQYSGENIGSGQTHFRQALEDWMASSSHCQMIMNPKMKDMGIGRAGTYWVQHFGSEMPPNTKRGKMRYTEN